MLFYYYFSLPAFLRVIVKTRCLSSTLRVCLLCSTDTMRILLGYYFTI